MPKGDRQHLARPMADRLWAKVDASGDCWVWKGSRTRKGHGQIRNEDGSLVYVHRVVYEMLVGPIPAGLTLDHLCRNQPCVNPDHLEPVTSAVNSRRSYSPWAINARKQVCGRGHNDWAPAAGDPPGRRVCRTCHSLHNRLRVRRQTPGALSRAADSLDEAMG